MKLWQIIQWGNIEEGGNGPDTQCIISAVDMKSAIMEGEARFSFYNSFSPKFPKEWKLEADVVYLLGEDHRPQTGEAILVVPVWVAHAFNMAHSPAWHRHPEDGWMTQEKMFGPDAL